MGRPCSRTVPPAGAYSPDTMLNRLVLPAPFGPISAWISPARMVSAASATAWMPPNALETPPPSSTGPALARGRGCSRQRPPAAREYRPDADQAAGRVKDEADEHEAEPKQPVRGPDR